MPDKQTARKGGGECGAANGPEGQRKIVWDQSGVHTLFPKVSQVKATREQFMLLFGTTKERHEDQHILGADLDLQIILSPLAAKRLAAALTRIMFDYESGFGSLDGTMVPHEMLEPTPPLRPPVFRSSKGVEKVARLFRFLEDQKIRPAFERSCGFLENKLFRNRFLLGFEKRMINGSPHEKISTVCEQLDMPIDFLESLQRHLPEANIVGFGFGEQEGACVVKAYLEFGSRFYRAVKSKPSKPDPYLSHLSFKWDAEDNTRKALARYTCFPGYTVEEMQAKLSQDFYGGATGGPFQIVKGILDLASRKAERQRFLYLDVKEENNPRSSFDINVYGANLQLQEVHHFLLDICRHYSIPEKQFVPFYDSAKTHILGHLAGGMNKEGRDFLTIYYGE